MPWVSLENAHEKNLGFYFVRWWRPPDMIAKSYGVLRSNPLLAVQQQVSDNAVYRQLECQVLSIFRPPQEVTQRTGVPARLAFTPH
jgi:hypothetical protein